MYFTKTPYVIFRTSVLRRWVTRTCGPTTLARTLKFRIVSSPTGNFSSGHFRYTKVSEESAGYDKLVYLFAQSVLFVFDEGSQVHCDQIVDLVNGILKGLSRGRGKVKVQRGVPFRRLGSIWVPNALGAHRRTRLLVYLPNRISIHNTATQTQNNPKNDTENTYLLLCRTLGQHIPIAEVVDIDIMRKLGIVRVPLSNLYASRRRPSRTKLGRDFCSDGGGRCGRFRSRLALFNFCHLGRDVVLGVDFWCGLVPFAFRRHWRCWRCSTSTGFVMSVTYVTVCDRIVETQRPCPKGATRASR